MQITARTDQVFIPPVHRQVAESDGHGSHHFVHIGAQQLNQDGEALLFSHRGPDEAGPLQEHTECLRVERGQPSRHAALFHISPFPKHSYRRQRHLKIKCKNIVGKT